MDWLWNILQGGSSFVGSPRCLKGTHRISVRYLRRSILWSNSQDFCTMIQVRTSHDLRRKDPCKERTKFLCKGPVKQLAGSLCEEPCARISEKGPWTNSHHHCARTSRNCCMISAQGPSKGILCFHRTAQACHEKLLLVLVGGTFHVTHHCQRFRFLSNVHT